MPYKIFAGSSHPTLAKTLVRALGVPLGKITLSTFSCGEKYVRINEDIHNKEVFILQTCRDQMTNEDLMELFLMCAAAKQASASKIHVIIPHFAYARQDKMFKNGEPISAKLMADLIAKSGANHVITFQLHSEQVRKCFSVPIDELTMEKAFADHFKKKRIKKLVIVAPDAGAAKMANRLAHQLGAETATIYKTRLAPNQSKVLSIKGNVKGKTCIIYDDMVDTGGTVVNAKKALLDHGANKDVYLCATHGILSGHAIKRLKQAKFKEVMLTDTLPMSKDKNFKGLLTTSVVKAIKGQIFSS